MRGTLICFALLLFSAWPAPAGQLRLDQRTKTYLEGVWSGNIPDSANDGRNSATYEFEFQRSGGILRYADSVDMDEWWRILGATQTGRMLRLKVREKTGDVSVHWFRMAPPSGLLELDRSRRESRSTLLSHEPQQDNPSRDKLGLVTAEFFSDTPPYYATFTHKPWARSASDACNKMPNAKSFIRLNLLAPSGFWLIRQSDSGIEDWSIATIDEDQGRKVLMLGLVPKERSGNNATNRTIHFEQVASDRIRVPEWGEEYFRCTVKNK